MADPHKVLKHLKDLKRDVIKTDPMSISLKHNIDKEKEKIFIVVTNGTTRRYPVRKSFLFKLLKWHRLSLSVLPKLSTETIVSIANDFLLNINSDYVNIKIENEEALTITSRKYSDIPDFEILQMCSGYGVESVSRDDFCMRIYSDIRHKSEPIPGDECGFGLNVFNSETGFMAFRAVNYIIRYICTNGATVRQYNDAKDKIYHYDINKERIFCYLEKSLNEIKNNLHQIEKKIKNSRSPITKDNIKFVKAKLYSTLGYSETNSFLKTIEENISEEKIINQNTETKYSLFNLLTSRAKEFDILKRAAIEETAGELLMGKEK